MSDRKMESDLLPVGVASEMLGKRLELRFAPHSETEQTHDLADGFAMTEIDGILNLSFVHD